MAKYIDGLLTGKLGNVIVCQGKFGPYLRSIPVRKAPISDAERLNHVIFRLVQQWLKPMNPFLKVGFRGYGRSHGAVSAISAMYQSGLVKNGFDSYIDAALVKVSAGKVGLAETISVFLDSERKLHFSWDTEVDRSNHPRDRVMLMAYNSDAGEAAYELNGPQRYEGSAMLDLSLMPIGRFHVYAAFVAANGEGQSDSRYLGDVEVGNLEMELENHSEMEDQ